MLQGVLTGYGARNTAIKLHQSGTRVADTDCFKTPVDKSGFYQGWGLTFARAKK